MKNSPKIDVQIDVTDPYAATVWRGEDCICTIAEVMYTQYTPDQAIGKMQGYGLSHEEAVFAWNEMAKILNEKYDDNRMISDN